MGFVRKTKTNGGARKLDCDEMSKICVVYEMGMVNKVIPVII